MKLSMVHKNQNIHSGIKEKRCSCGGGVCSLSIPLKTCCCSCSLPRFFLRAQAHLGVVRTYLKTSRIQRKCQTVGFMHQRYRFRIKEI